MTSATAPKATQSTRFAWLQRIPRVYIALLVLVLVLGLLSWQSVLPTNLLNMVRQGGPLGLAAIGQTFVWGKFTRWLAKTVPVNRR